MLHTGHRTLNANHKMGATVQGTTVKEKDLGVKISADMKFQSSVVLQFQRVITFLG